MAGKRASTGVLRGHRMAFGCRDSGVGSAKSETGMLRFEAMTGGACKFHRSGTDQSRSTEDSIPKNQRDWRGSSTGPISLG